MVKRITLDSRVCGNDKYYTPSPDASAILHGLQHDNSGFPPEILHFVQNDRKGYGLPLRSCDCVVRLSDKDCFAHLMRARNHEKKKGGV